MWARAIFLWLGCSLSWEGDRRGFHRRDAGTLKAPLWVVWEQKIFGTSPSNPTSLSAPWLRKTFCQHFRNPQFPGNLWSCLRHPPLLLHLRPCLSLLLCWIWVRGGTSRFTFIHGLLHSPPNWLKTSQLALHHQLCWVRPLLPHFLWHSGATAFWGSPSVWASPRA